MGENNSPKLGPQRSREIFDGSGIKQTMVLLTIHAIVIFGIVAILWPLFSQGFNSLPVDISLALVGLLIGILLPIVRAIFSKIIR